MKKKRNILFVAVKYTLYSIILLALLFGASTCLWIIITDYMFRDFFRVLSLILRNAGSYSTLLVGVVITVFFQIYSREKDAEKEDKIKISEVGYYTLAFKREEDDFCETFYGEKW